MENRRRAYSVAQAAEELNCNRASVYRKIYRGELKVLTGLGRLTIPSEEMDKFLGSTTVYKRRSRRHFGQGRLKGS